jgi:hypothetical protein
VITIYNKTTDTLFNVTPTTKENDYAKLVFKCIDY